MSKKVSSSGVFLLFLLGLSGVGHGEDIIVDGIKAIEVSNGNQINIKYIGETTNNLLKIGGENSVSGVVATVEIEDSIFNSNVLDLLNGKSIAVNSLLLPYLEEFEVKNGKISLKPSDKIEGSLIVGEEGTVLVDGEELILDELFLKGDSSNFKGKVRGYRVELLGKNSLLEGEVNLLSEKNDSNELIVAGEGAKVTGDVSCLNLTLGKEGRELNYNWSQIIEGRWIDGDILKIEAGTVLKVNKDLEQEEIELEILGRLEVDEGVKLGVDRLTLASKGVNLVGNLSANQINLEAEDVYIDGEIDCAKIILGGDKELDYHWSQVIRGAWTSANSLEIGEGTTLILDKNLDLSSGVTVTNQGVLKLIFASKNQWGQLGNAAVSNLGKLEIVTTSLEDLSGTYSIAGGIGESSPNLKIGKESSRFYRLSSKNEGEKTCLILTSVLKDLNNEDIYRIWRNSNFMQNSLAARIQNELKKLLEGSEDRVSLRSNNDGNGIEIDFDQAVREVAPVSSPYLYLLSQEVNRWLERNISSQLTNKDKEHGFWIGAMHTHARQLPKGYNPGFKANLRGFVMGGEASLAKNFLGGAGYLYHTATIDSSSHHLNAAFSHTAFIYGRYQPKWWYLQGTINCGYARYNEQSRVIGGNVIDATYRTYNMGINLITGYEFEKIGLVPECGLRYLYLKQGDYSDFADQRIMGQHSKGLTGTCGVRYTHEITLNKVIFTPDFYLRGVYEIINEHPKIDVKVGESEYQMKGSAICRLGLESGLALTAHMKAVDLSLIYDFSYRSDYLSHTGMLRVKYNF